MSEDLRTKDLRKAPPASVKRAVETRAKTTQGNVQAAHFLDIELVTEAAKLANYKPTRQDVEVLRDALKESTNYRPLTEERNGPKNSIERRQV